MAGELHLGNALAARPVEDIERAVGFVAHIHALAVGREIDAVRGLDRPDRLHHFLGGGIDDVDAVAGAVGDVDARGLRRGGQRDEHQGKD